MRRTGIRGVLARYVAASVFVLVLGSALSTAAFFAIQNKERAAAQQAFDDAAQNQVAAIRRRIEESADTVRALGALFASSESVTREQFRAFTATELSFSPGIQALEWIPHVSSAMRGDFENAARKSFPSFQITERGASGQMVSARARDEYFPVYYVEPYGGNESALGFDLASNPARLAALRKARDTGTMVASEPVTLVQEKGRQRGFLLFLPVYRDGTRLDSVAERRRNLAGFALGVFRIGDLVNAAISPLPSSDINGRLYDDAAPSAERLLDRWVGGTAAGSIRSRETEEKVGFKVLATFEVGGRRWSLAFTPVEGHYTDATLSRAWSVLVAGLLLTALLTGYLLALRRGARDLFESTSLKLATEARLSGVLNAVDAIVFSVAPETGAISHLSPAAERVLGRPVTAFYEDKRLALEIILPEDRPRVLKTRGGGDGEPAQPIEYRVIRPDGEVRWLEETATTVTNAQDRPLRIDVLARDITARKRAEQALRESEELFRQLSGNIPEAFWVREVATNKILYVGPVWREITGREKPVDLGSMLQSTVHPDDYQRVLAEVRKSPHGGIDHEFRIVRPEGLVRWFHVQTFPIRDDAGEIYRVAGVGADVTERKAAAERLLQVTHYDHVTDLPNRSFFYEALKRSLEQARSHHWHMGVLFIDLDRFKVVNDTLGHATGDALLQQVGARLLQCVRVRDVVGRLGGDEFAVLLPALDKPDDAAAVAAKVVGAFGTSFKVEGREVYITASVGITVYPGDAADADSLLRCADVAMYRAKEEGRNRYCYYTAEMNARAAEKLELETSLRHALERSEFLLHYQPKLDLQSGKICGLEALLRWQRPEIGLVPPADFVPLLEETGLIVPVGEWVIGETCRQLKLWQADGAELVPVAVNLSGRQFQKKDLAGFITRTAGENGIAPQLLQCELTESSLMSQAEQTIDILKELHVAGIKIAVDDFGTGYSSLAYLKRFPIDALKIDQSFVRNIATDPDDAAIVMAVITLAHTLGIKVIAEGVETAEQLQFLHLNRCDEIQGYFFSRPVSASEIANLLRDNPRTRRHWSRVTAVSSPGNTELP